MRDILVWSDIFTRSGINPFACPEPNLKYYYSYLPEISTRDDRPAHGANFLLILKTTSPKLNDLEIEISDSIWWFSTCIQERISWHNIYKKNNDMVCSSLAAS